MGKSFKHNKYTGFRDGYGSSDERYIKCRRITDKKKHRCKNRSDMSNIMSNPKKITKTILNVKSKAERKQIGCFYCARGYHRYRPEIWEEDLKLQLSHKTNKLVIKDLSNKNAWKNELSFDELYKQKKKKLQKEIEKNTRIKLNQLLSENGDKKKTQTPRYGPSKKLANTKKVSLEDIEKLFKSRKICKKHMEHLVKDFHKSQKKQEKKEQKEQKEKQEEQRKRLKKRQLKKRKEDVDSYDSDSDSDMEEKEFQRTYYYYSNPQETEKEFLKFYETKSLKSFQSYRKKMCK